MITDINGPKSGDELTTKLRKLTVAAESVNSHESTGSELTEVSHSLKPIDPDDQWGFLRIPPSSLLFGVAKQGGLKNSIKPSIFPRLRPGF